MKTLNLFTILTLVILPLGAILMLGGNHIGEYLVVTGAIMGMYTMHLIDKEEAKKPENTL